MDPGNLAGKYRLLATLGHGGMADVYLASAQGPAGFNKLLVVKELRPALAQDPDFLAMFLDEARLAARLSHANVVHTYEIFGHQARYFIAMEYLDGQPLNRILAELAKRDGLPRALGLRIVCEALSGLHYAHELRDYSGAPLEVVHRDVTPHNVLVTYEGQVKLVDFGIAKALDSSTETRIGMLKGKVGYMAPEQARGEAVDRRSDIYGVGVLLWELLARRRMWRGAIDVLILSRLAAGDVPSLAAVTSDVPDELLRIVARATAASPSARYYSAAELRDELETYLRGAGDASDLRSVASLMAATFADERERMRALIQLQLLDTTRLPAELEHTSTSRSGSLDPRLDSLRVMAVTPPPPLPTPLLPRALSGGSAAPEVETAVFPQARRTRRVRVPWVLGASLFGGLAALSLLGWRARESLAPTKPPAESPPALAAALRLSAASRASACGAAHKPRLEISGDVERDATLSCENEYLLKFTTYVKPGTTLTIQPGTRIVGDRATRGALVVQPGGRLVARGTPQAPIVFTSERGPGQARSGDWGGLLLLGRAPTNLRDQAGAAQRGKVEGVPAGVEYGGDLPDDDSGVLSYVRIEYSGIEIAPGNEINGLTLAGVGRGTVIDHVQVRHTADDCFEFFGGTVSARYLICQDAGDDGFDWDLGYTGKLQFLLLEAGPAPDSDSNGLEGDNDPNGSQSSPISSPTIFNATLCGRALASKREHYGALLRRGTRGSIANAVFMGFGAGLDVRDQRTDVELGSSAFFGNLSENLAYAEQAGGLGSLEDDDAGFDERRFLLTSERSNSQRDPSISGCEATSRGPFGPLQPLTEGAARPPGDGFFDTSAQYMGALRDRQDRWAQADWVRWD
ncbi:MAG TPA: serine/threonine-protein kinase [Polyangiaceae bacterium]